MYDFVGSKMEWLGAGLPFEGGLADLPLLGTLAQPVPTCRPDERLSDVAVRMDGPADCIVTADDGVVLGRLTNAVFDGAGTRIAGDAMDEAPTTYRPHMTAQEVLDANGGKAPTAGVLVSALDGRLVGCVSAERLRRHRQGA